MFVKHFNFTGAWMSDEIKSQITNCFDQACSDQFKSMGCGFSEVKNLSHANEMIASYISAGSDELEVALLLKVPRLLLAQTMPVIDEQSIADIRYQEDWNSELVNRFLGRLKNMLLTYGCRLSVGLPEVLTDTDLNHYKHAFDGIVRLFEVSSDITCSVVECYLNITILNESLSLSMDADAPLDQSSDGGLTFL
jgi:hypothetical protein